MFYELNYSKFFFFGLGLNVLKGYQKSEFCLKQGRKISDFCLKQGQGMRGRAARIYRVPSPPPCPGLCDHSHVRVTCISSVLGVQILFPSSRV